MSGNGTNGHERGRNRRQADPPERDWPDERGWPEEPPTVEVRAPDSPTIAMPVLRGRTARPPARPEPPRTPPAESPPDEPPTVSIPARPMPAMPRPEPPQQADAEQSGDGHDGQGPDAGSDTAPTDTAPTETADARAAATTAGGRGSGEAVGIGRASGVMALGTLASRLTGFLRTVAITAAIGTGLVGDSYNVANTTPNILYDLLLGGVLTSVVVPVLARAAKEDSDGGEAFANSLLTLVMIGLTAIVAIGLLAAPLIVRLYVSRGDEAALATTFLRYFLPQVVFYGVGATIGAILNLRNRFAAPMATPVLNNLVVIATCIVFVLMAGTRPPTLGSISGNQTAVLGIGTTLGIVVMTVALLPSLRASGFRYRPRLDLRHPGLRSAARLAGWVLLFVVTSQVSYFVVTRLATAGVAYTTYFTAFQLFQLPHAIIAVSVITALLPRMSRHAAEQRLDLVRDDLSTGLRLATVIIVPAALGLLALATPISVAIFAHGATSVSDAHRIGSALAAFAVALVPFSAFQLQLRAFYALADSRTPAMVNFAIAGTNMVTALLLSAALPRGDRAVALALAFALAYLVGAIVCSRLLVRRLAGLDAYRLIRTLVRTAVAGASGAVLALVLSRVLISVLASGSVASLVAVVLAAIVGGAAYFFLAVRMKVDELSSFATMLRSRLGR